MHSASQLKALSKDNNIRINKRSGQNFLVDENYLNKIISSCNITENDLVLEIGAGLGALTESIAPLCKHLIAIEVDKKFCSFLKDALLEYKNVEIVCADILKYDIKSAGEKLKHLPTHRTDRQGKFKVIGNLPYYITSPIITYLINNRKSIQSAFITVQKEVAERLMSSPARKTYGSLSCFVQFYTKPDIMVSMPKEAFYPVPQVESSLVRLEFLKNPSVKVKDESLFFKIVNAAFNKRRKTLLNALSLSGAFNLNKEQVNKILLGCGIDPKRRGETLSLKEFADLTEEFDRSSK